MQIQINHRHEGFSVFFYWWAIQHCAMPNKGDTLRTGILQSMAPAYIKLFEAMADYVRDNIKRSRVPPSGEYWLWINWIIL